MYTTAPNYDGRSRNPYCSVTGLPKLPHETRIFRLADIEFEGSFDIGEAVVIDMAKELGMVRPEVHEAVLDELALAEAALLATEDRINQLEAALAAADHERNELIAEIYERDNEVHGDYTEDGSE
jgi:hypothetical protein